MLPITDMVPELGERYGVTEIVRVKICGAPKSARLHWEFGRPTKVKYIDNTRSHLLSLINLDYPTSGCRAVRVGVRLAPGRFELLDSGVHPRVFLL